MGKKIVFLVKYMEKYFNYILIQYNMGQQEVFDFLMKNPKKYWNSKEIADGLEASIGSVTTTLAKLRKRHDVKYKMASDKKNMFLYKYKS